MKLPKGENIMEALAIGLEASVGILFPSAPKPEAPKPVKKPVNK